MVARPLHPIRGIIFGLLTVTVSFADSEVGLAQTGYLPKITLPAAQDTTWQKGHLLRQTAPPAILITLGLLAYREGGLVDRTAVKEWRQEFIPEFENDIDDWGQVAPGLLALGLSIGGVPGAHNTSRSTGSWALSLGIMMGGTHAVKNLAHVMRPSGANNHSFPSGHTASAFTSARYLHREYGHVNPLYPIVGYSIAAGTGVLRQLNDAHWLSDVLVGAGIGFLSTDLAYAIMDEVFGDRGRLSVEPREERPKGNPSFLDYRLGYANHTGDIDDRDGTFKADEGWVSGFEGAWFPWRNLGFGGEWSWSAFPISNEGFTPSDAEVDRLVSEFYTQPFGAEYVMLGPFMDLPIGDRWTVTARLTGGVALGATGVIGARIEDEFIDQVGAEEVPLLEYDPDNTLGFALGGGVRFLLGERMTVRAFGEWNSSKPDYVVREVLGVNPQGLLLRGQGTIRESVDFSFFGFGLSVSALLW